MRITAWSVRPYRPSRARYSDLKSNTFSAPKTLISPAFFTLGGGVYVAALHADYSLVGAALPAKPGETILLYGTGFGPANPVQITIGGVTAAVAFAGLVSPPMVI